MYDDIRNAVACPSCLAPIGAHCVRITRRRVSDGTKLHLGGVVRVPHKTRRMAHERWLDELTKPDEPVVLTDEQVVDAMTKAPDTRHAALYTKTVTICEVDDRVYIFDADNQDLLFTFVR